MSELPMMLMFSRSRVDDQAATVRSALLLLGKIIDSDDTPVWDSAAAAIEELVGEFDQALAELARAMTAARDNYVDYVEARMQRDDALAALKVARPYVEQDYGTGDWQKRLENDQEIIDAALGSRP